MFAMASFRATRFPCAMFDQNFPRSNFNMNPSGDSQFQPQFQRPPSAPFRPLHTAEAFMAGNFQKPPFSNFPDPAGTNVLRNRPPPPNPVFCSQIPPPNQMFRMNLPPPPPDQVFRINTPPPNQMFRMNQPPPHEVFRMTPSPSPEMFRMNVPPPDQPFRSPTPVQRPRFSGAPFERPFRPFNPMSSFRNSSRPPFQNPPPPQSSSFHQKDLPLQANNKQTYDAREFRNSPRFPFQNRPHSQAASYQQKDHFSQANKKRKQKVREFRKLKEDTTEKPFSCDTCDRAFITDDLLKEHLSQHIKCDLGNCTFEAHPKIVALHKKMQHETGYADTINRLQDDAEIQKWREERRRHFPTAENIKKRQAEQAEREARGEVLETKEFGKFKRRPEGNGNLMRNRNQTRRRGSFRRHDRRRNFQRYQDPQPTTVNLDSDSDSDSDSHIKLKKFSGLQSLTNSVSEKCDVIEDAEVTSSPQAPNTANELISSENLSEQNLSKSYSDHVSYADNSSSNLGHDETSFVLSSEKVDDVTLPADESVCEIPEKEIEYVTQIHKVVTIEDSDDEGPISIPIQMSLKDGCGNQDIDDDEGPEAAPIYKSVEDSIIGDSQSIKNADSEGPEVAPIVKSVEIPITRDNRNADSEGPDVAPIAKTVEIPITRDNERIEEKSREVCDTSSKRKRDGNGEQNRKRPNNEHFKQNGFNAQKPVFQARKSSLLEKLLADDIRHERNVVLQCIRHIVNNDFFGMSKKS